MNPVLHTGRITISSKWFYPFNVQPRDDKLAPATELIGRKEEQNTMTRINSFILKMKIWKDTQGQDLIEYALMAGFVAVAAGAIMPGVATSISTIFSKIASVMTAAASTS
jgi:pilus assembly protein Flp/PilA